MTAMTAQRFRELDRLMRQRPEQRPLPVSPSLHLMARQRAATSTTLEEHDRGHDD